MSPKVGQSFISEDAKLKLLEKLFEKKDILFGPFTEQVTRQNRIDEWQGIFDYAINIGYKFPEKSNYSYLRDTIWPNYRRRTMGKIRSNISLNQVDEILMKIVEASNEKIHITSAISTVDGCDSSSNEYFEEIPVKHETISADIDYRNSCEPLPVEHANELSMNSQPSKKRKLIVSREIHQQPFLHSKSNDLNHASSNDSDESLSIEHRRLENENLRLKNYKMRLEIFALENQLNLEHYDV